MACDRQRHHCVRRSLAKFNEAYLVEANVNYAVSFNGKARFNIQVANGTDKAEVERLALEMRMPHAGLKAKLW